MNKPLKLIPIGNSTGVILPKELLNKLRLNQGDQVFVTESSDGSVRLSAYDDEFARQTELAEQIMREDRDILRALAK